MTPHLRLRRMEQAAFALGFAALLWLAEAPWYWVLAGLILPDLSLIAYRWGPRTGALWYNLVHTYLCPAALVLVAAGLARLLPPYQAAVPLGHVTIAIALHIAIDRALGFGLKLPGDFKDTHLGRIGQ